MRQGQDWVAEERAGFPADAGKVQQTLLGLADLRYVEAKTRKAQSYPRLGVEDGGGKESRSTLITIADDKGGSLGEIIIGKRRVDQLGGGNDGIYLRKPSDAQSWLARGALELDGTFASWLDRKVVDIAPEKVKQATLTQPDGSAFTIARKAADDPLELVDVPGSTKLRNVGALEGPASALANLELTDVRPAGEIAIPEAETAHAEFITLDGLTIKIALLDKDGVTWARLAASGSGDAEKTANDLNARLSRWVYAIAPASAAALRTKLSELIEPPKPS